MLKKMFLITALLFGGFSFAQLNVPIDVEIGSKWFLQDSASLFFSARTYFPLKFQMLGVTPYLIPEAGLHYESLQPYVSLELNADAEYGTLAIFGTYTEGVGSLSVSTRLCILSDKCKE